MFLGRTDAVICPVEALLAYLAKRGSGDGPLFHFEKGQPLMRSHLVMRVNRALQETGLQPETYM